MQQMYIPSAALVVAQSCKAYNLLTRSCHQHQPQPRLMPPPRPHCDANTQPCTCTPEYHWRLECALRKYQTCRKQPTQPAWFHHQRVHSKREYPSWAPPPRTPMRCCCQQISPLHQSRLLQHPALWDALRQRHKHPLQHDSRAPAQALDSGEHTSPSAAAQRDKSHDPPSLHFLPQCKSHRKWGTQRQCRCGGA